MKTTRSAAGRASSLAAASAITLLILLVTITQIAPPTLSSTRLLSSTTLFRKSPSSAWFAEGGYLRRDPSDGYASTYELRDVGEKVYACDEYEVSEKGTRRCTSTVRLMRALRDNSVAQVEAVTRRSLSEGSGQTVIMGDGEAEGAVIEETVEAELGRTAEALRGLRGKRVLYLGDSIDRYPLEELPLNLPSSALVVIDPANGHIMEAGATPAPGAPVRGHTTTFFNIRLANSIQSSHASDEAYHPSRRMHPDDFRIDLLFTFGLYHYPTLDDFMARVALMEPIVGSDAEYDLICVNAGLWDMEAMMYPDNDGKGISAYWVDQYVDRYIALIDRLRAKYGSRIPIAIRLTHDTHHMYDASQFRPLRSEHVRQAQREVARRTGVRLLPFGQLMASQPDFYIYDGVHPTPEANLVHMETVLRMVQES
jgi:hypothetical protein